jgi:two-component sensor histidine kinase
MNRWIFTLKRQVRDKTELLQKSHDNLEETVNERIIALKVSLKEKEVLLSEIHHRVKNSMQVIISLLRLQADKIEDKKYADVFKEGEDRIRSMEKG